MTVSMRPKPTDPNATGSGKIAEREFLVDALNAESEAVRRLADRLTAADTDGWHSALDLLEACRGHVVVCGMGKSGLIGAKISSTLSSLGQPSHVVHPAEAMHGDLGRIRPGDVVLLLSFSGETDEVVSLASILKADGVARIGMSSKPASSLARQCDVHLNLGDVVEACPLRLAPTASTTAMLAAGDALALALARRRAETSFTGNDNKHKALIIITDGENHEEDAVEAAKKANEKGIIIHTIGMGTVNGAPIPIFRNGVQVNFQKDHDGNTVITKLETLTLERIAAEGKGVFIQASNNDDGLNSIFNQISKMEKKSFGTKQFTGFEDRFQYFLAAGLLLLLLEYTVTGRKSKIIQKLDLFHEGKKKSGNGY